MCATPFFTSTTKSSSAGYSELKSALIISTGFFTTDFTVYLNTNSLPASAGLKSILTLDPYTFASVAGLPSIFSSSPTNPYASGHNLLNFDTDIVSISFVSLGP